MKLPRWLRRPDPTPSVEFLLSPYKERLESLEATLRAVDAVLRSRSTSATARIKEARGIIALHLSNGRP